MRPINPRNRFVANKGLNTETRDELCILGASDVFRRYRASGLKRWVMKIIDEALLDEVSA